MLVAVCYWLIYQVKHSHDKRKQFDENNAIDSLNVEDNSVLVKLGRKDLIPQEKGRKKESESHDGEVEEDENEEGNLEQDKREEESREEAKHEEETKEENRPEEEESEENDRHEEATEKEEEHEEETGEEDRHDDETGEEDKHEEETNEKDNHEEESGAKDKHEEQEQEEEIQSEEKDDGRGVEDIEVNQHESEKADTDVDGEEESIDEEKDKEDPIKEETKDKDDEDKDTLTKNDPSIEHHVHDEGSLNTREAREEQYKGDDASSAVTHDAQSTSTENKNGSSGSQFNILEHESKVNSTEENKNATVVNLPEVETAGNGTSALDEENKQEQGSINNTDNSGSLVKNETEIIISDPSRAHDATEGDITTTDGSNIQTVSLNQATNFTVPLQNTQVNSNLSNSNATKSVEGNSEESTDSSTKSEFDNSKNVEWSNVLAEGKDGSDSVVIEETTNEVKNENPDNIKVTDGTYENSDFSNTENTDEVQYDSTDTSDPSVPVDDKENRIDLDTLPEIKTEGSNSEEVAED